MQPDILRMSEHGGAGTIPKTGGPVETDLKKITVDDGGRDGDPGKSPPKSHGSAPSSGTTRPAGATKFGIPLIERHRALKQCACLVENRTGSRAHVP